MQKVILKMPNTYNRTTIDLLKCKCFEKVLYLGRETKRLLWLPPNLYPDSVGCGDSAYLHNVAWTQESVKSGPKENGEPLGD